MNPIKELEELMRQAREAERLLIASNLRKAANGLNQKAATALREFAEKVRTGALSA